MLAGPWRRRATSRRPAPPPTFSMRPDTTWPRHAPQRQNDTRDTPARPRAAGPAARARKARLAADWGDDHVSPEEARPGRPDAIAATNLPPVDDISGTTYTSTILRRTITILNRASNDFASTAWPAGLAFLDQCLFVL
jgi:hypothetical protein